MRRTLVVVAAIAAGVVSGCGGDAQSEELSSGDFADWPLTADSGTLHCEGSDGMGKVSIEVDGVEYAVNGLAKGDDRFQPIDPIWADNPDVDGLKQDIGPLIEEGLSLCK